MWAGAGAVATNNEKKRQVSGVLLIAAWVVVFLPACRRASSGQETVPADMREATAVVEAGPADSLTAGNRRDIDGVSGATRQDRVSFNGTLVIPPQYFASVTLSMGGIVKFTSLIPGMYVGKGAVLATLENPDFILLQQAYLDSHAQCAYLEAEYVRQQNLAKEEAASQKKLQQIQADYLSMKSRLQATEAQLDLLGIEADGLLTTGIRPYLEVKAPLSGYVGNLQINRGKHLEAGETLCNIIDKSQMLLRLQAYEKDLADLTAGSAVEFRVNGLGDKVFSARLISVGQEVDEASRSLEVYAKVLQSDPFFRPGMYVTAQIARGSK